MIKKQTAIKYAKALKEYCESQPYCEGCPFECSDPYLNCEIANLQPCNWEIQKDDLATMIQAIQIMKKGGDPK